MKLSALDGFAQAHHGLVTLQAANELGMGRSTWYDSVRRGDLVALHPNVARLPGSPERREQSILGAILALRQGANAPTVVMASHRSAAFLLGVERPPTDPIDVIVDRACQRSLPGVEIHRPTDRIDLVPTTRSGVTTSNELRTLVDLGALDPSGVTAALDLFTVTRRLTMAGLSALLARHSRKGRAGVTALRRAVEAWPLADDIPDSELEIAMARLITDHGLPTASFHRRIAEYEVDFHFDGTPIVVECDGWTYHVADHHAWERDRERDARLHAAGYIVVRLSRREVLFQPDRTADKIRSVLDRWTSPPAA